MIEWKRFAIAMMLSCAIICRMPDPPQIEEPGDVQKPWVECCVTSYETEISVY